jgi:NADH-quinone oxidoreductase subunit D
MAEPTTEPSTEHQPKRRLMTLNVGPQHPATHGVLRMKLLLDGERIVDAEPIIGYLHRGSERLGEMGTYLQFIPYTDRLDYLAAIHNNMAFVHACEKLADLEAPPRGKVLRVLAQEINRVCSHLIWMGTFGIDVGAMTTFFWCFRDREKGLRLLERMTGTRLTYSYIRFGGVKHDVDEDWIQDTYEWVDEVRDGIQELDDLLTENDIFVARTKGTGVITQEQALDYGMTGPNLRSTGKEFDLRKEEPYCDYDTYDFDVPTRDEGDVFSRYVLRMAEIEESLGIIEQACERWADAEGGHISREVGEGSSQFRWSPPEGEAYGRIEAPRGEAGALIVSDGSNQPYRVKWRAHSFSNLSAISELARGELIQDAIITLGSLDIVLGDIDR